LFACGERNGRRRWAVPTIVGAGSGSGTGGADASDRLMEIVVTAQKRTEIWRTMPISAQVVSGQTLKELNYNRCRS